MWAGGFLFSFFFVLAPLRDWSIFGERTTWTPTSHVVMRPATRTLKMPEWRWNVASVLLKGQSTQKWRTTSPLHYFTTSPLHHFTTSPHSGSGELPQNCCRISWNFFMDKCTNSSVINKINTGCLCRASAVFTKRALPCSSSQTDHNVFFLSQNPLKSF